MYRGGRSDRRMIKELETGASPVDRSNSIQSTGFDIIVLTRRGHVCIINLIRIASRYASAIPLACGHYRDSLQTKLDAGRGG